MLSQSTDPQTARRALPRVVVVAQAAPALGGIASFAQLLVGDPALARRAQLILLNTTRKAVRRAGRLTADNVWHALQDIVRVFRLGRTADVVHVQAAPGRIFPLLRMFALCLAGRASGARVLCHVHSGRINGGNPEGFDPGRSFRLVLARMTFVDAILTVSRAGAQILAPLVPGTRVEWVDNAVRVPTAPVAHPGDRPAMLLFVGTLSRRKGGMDLAQAVRALRERVPHGWDLQVVGGAAEVGEAEAEEIRSALRAAGFGHALVGPLEAAEVRRRMAAAAALVLPSHWEGQPMVILEAMALGLPIVSSTVGAIPDVVRDGEEGLLIEPHDVGGLTDALERIVTDDALRVRLGTAAHARARQKYDVEVLADRLGTFYEEAASRRRAAG